MEGKKLMNTRLPVKELAVIDLVRKHIRNIKPYSSARHEFSGKAIAHLDANENGLGAPSQRAFAVDLHRYPNSYPHRLIEKYAKIAGINADQVFISNGSDEAIDLLIRLFCEPGQDKILVFEPTFGIYECCAANAGVEVRKVSLDKEFDIPLKEALSELTPEIKIVFLCSPNNPTGNLLSRDRVEAILGAASGIVVVDEAYIEFSGSPGFVGDLGRYSKLVVLRTLSKAWGLAGARVGMTLASAEIVNLINRIRLPYNVGSLAQHAAIEALDRAEIAYSNVQLLKKEREYLVEQLNSLPIARKIYPSKSNFILVQFSDATTVMRSLRREGIIVRDQSEKPGCADCLRITVGAPDENDMLIQLLYKLARREFLPRRSERTVSIRRKTNETDIRIRLALDGSGRGHIASGLGFFDHMLNQIVTHSGIDLELRTDGDLETDEHHSIEDTGIALGSALRQALGDKRGIERFSFVAPLDESEAAVTLDLSGRAYLCWDVPFRREKIGDVPTEMFRHFFYSLADACAFTLHIRARGENEHHLIESVFKAFARALRVAIAKSGSSQDLPSSKGSL